MADIGARLSIQPREDKMEENKIVEREREGTEGKVKRTKDA